VPANLLDRQFAAERLLTFDLEKLDLVGVVRPVEEGKVIEVIEHSSIVHASLVDFQYLRERDVCLKGISSAGSRSSLLTRLCCDETSIVVSAVIAPRSIPSRYLT
jgi:hypothetical protein